MRYEWLNFLERIFFYIKINYILINRKYIFWLLECVEKVLYAFYVVVVLSKESGELGIEGLFFLEGLELVFCFRFLFLGFFISIMGNL